MPLEYQKGFAVILVTFGLFLLLSENVFLYNQKLNKTLYLLKCDKVSLEFH